MNTIVASRYVGQRTGGDPVGGEPAGPSTRRAPRAIAGRLTLPLLVGVLAVAGSAGCSSKDRAPAPSAGQPSASSSAGIGGVPTTSTVDPGASPAATAAGQPGNNPGKPAATPTGGAKPGAATSPVQIVQFRIQQKPTCPQGTSEFPVEATPLVIEWKVTGAEQVELAVDGPGLYDTYPAQGKESFTFSCGGEPGSTEKHTYKLTAKHGKYVETRTLTATATVYDKANV
ncbi:hypothetical protein AB0J90_14020 [Micromonospora sp. NPDC049523]|uniref:hypothetical protein n=1 Tax=Micromonospora sp. NPDC049523 TaxID=3155921 RepID=UPI0034412357